jgi:hypothetical protein
MRVIALKWNILDMPGGRKTHEKGTPLLGGVAVMAAFTAAFLGNMVLERQVVVLLCGGIVVASQVVCSSRRQEKSRYFYIFTLFDTGYKCHCPSLCETCRRDSSCCSGLFDYGCRVHSGVFGP